VPALAESVDRMLSSGQLALSRIQRDSQFPSRSHERLDQFHQGVRVLGGQLVWQKESGLVLSVTGNLYEGVEVNVSPTLTPDAAGERALAVGEPGASIVGETQLLIVPLRERFALVYALHLRGQATLEAIYVDAHSGDIALRYDDHRRQTGTVGLAIGTWSDQKKMTVENAAGTHRAVDRVRPFGIKTYDVNFAFNVWNAYMADQDAFLATDSDNEWRDGAVVDAHTFAGYTYDYYFKRHGRRGLDDRGLAAINFVHIVRQNAGFNNAFFDPVDTSMNYGDGDGITFAFFSAALDVVAHELTHGVTQFSSDLIYLNESGALNEAISDIMAAAVEFEFQPAGRGRLRADWLLGEDLYLNFGPFFRTFIDPLSLGDPDNYQVRCDAQCPEDFDNGGVHINSSIANHAFYLMVMGGRNRTSGIQVQGLGIDQMDKIESIFYRAFFFYLVPSSDFADAREATIRAARELYGSGSIEEQTVRNGWTAVGVQ
jgi:thermolysin